MHSTLKVSVSLYVSFREVFKARHKETRVVVAMKKLLMENDTEGVGSCLYYVLVTHSYSSPPL